MAALGWLLNLDFAASASSAPPQPAPTEPFRGGGGGPRRYTMVWSPEPGKTKKPYTNTEIKKLLRKVAETDNENAKRELERKARNAHDAVMMIHDVQRAIFELSRQITTRARELDITHQWAQKMIERIEDERNILVMLLEADD